MVIDAPSDDGSETMPCDISITRIAIFCTKAYVSRLVESRSPGITATMYAV